MSLDSSFDAEKYAPFKSLGSGSYSYLGSTKSFAGASYKFFPKYLSEEEESRYKNTRLFSLYPLLFIRPGSGE